MKTIGVLLDQQVFRNIPRSKTGHERIDFYRKACSKHGVNLLLMSLPQLDFNRRQANGYEWKGKGYRFVTRPIPPVIHNRAMPFTQSLRRRLAKLNAIRYVFNGQNRYSKYNVHRILGENSAILKHLPQTKSFGRDQLRSMMSRYNSLYIKPQNGSVGKGIIRIRRRSGGIWAVQTLKGTYKVRTNLVYGKLKSLTRGRAFLIQKDIDLAQYRGRPYDIRVSVQKGHGGRWQITGMVGKVAKRGNHVTNVARGGSLMRCENLFRSSRLPAEIVKTRIQRLSLRITEYLSARLNRLSDVGLDIGIDHHGKPFFIEVNGRDQRYSFAKAGMRQNFFATYENPIRYAAYLARRR